jgi:alkylresorcinol/alkylpyrone synthase
MAAGLRPDVEKFLAESGFELADVGVFVCHPGGPKVLEAIERSLSLPPDALAASWDHLARVGNLSSASVLFVLGDALAAKHAPGTLGLLLAMGPGFCSELVLLQW